MLQPPPCCDFHSFQHVMNELDEALAEKAKADARWQNAKTSIVECFELALCFVFAALLWAGFA